MQSSLAAAPTAAGEEYWTLVKRQFPLAEGLLYLNAANVCPSSRPVLDRHQEYLRDFHADPSFQNRDKYDAIQESLRGKLAKMLEAGPDEIAVTRNTSEGSNIVVNGLDLKAGDEIIITTHNHPSSNDSWKVRAKRHGLIVKEAAVPIPAASGQQLLDSIAGLITSRTKVLAVTHVTSTTGNRYPAQEIGRLARQRNIWYHLDGAQTFGAFDVSVKRIGCDSYAGSAHKWFMGPLEAGVLYVREERIAQLWPSIVTAKWQESQKGARKFEVYGQRDNPRIAAFEAGVDFIQLIGMAAIERRLGQLVTRLKDNLASIPEVHLKTSRDWQLSGGVVKFQVKGKATAALYDALYTKHRVALAQTASGESEGLRFSPHVYNSMEEMDRAAAIVRKLI
ncbi:MAG: aminotransferase class V-fold PLP-dependent enzyme [Bryobacterales bacterium]|nr:aminotransferase class V-fold PLP-dependent enzyme [Bryobacterales bacterium]